MKESYEGSRLVSTRSGSAVELSRLLAGGAKQKNPARTVDALKTRTSVISPTLADYPIKGLQQHPVKDALSSDISKYLKFHIQVPNLGSFISWLFPATAEAVRGGGGLERKEGSVVVPTEPVLLSLEVCGGDGGGLKVLS
ncbi:hypothetical protein L3X38_004612 [Prunus dulcis]|uniref:Uncharacterized protein n=1 Tax=Prunus dulcis TaxID=3755 RepID=A0AAD5F394_PRUDU|nr:hypothetical protein L3X38_004612 [Prunus dulcis]